MNCYLIDTTVVVATAAINYLPDSFFFFIIIGLIVIIQDAITLYGMPPLPGVVISLSPYVGRVEAFFAVTGIDYTFVMAPFVDERREVMIEWHQLN